MMSRRKFTAFCVG